MPGPGVRRPRPAPPRRRARPRLRPRRLFGVNLTAFESRLKTTWRTRRSSPRTMSTSGRARVRAGHRARSPARAPSRRRARAPRAARTRAISSSTCPASTFERSSTSLISDSRWFPDERMSSRYSSCFSLTVAEQLLAQQLREADDRVQRRPQLVRHVREELALVPARRLELAVEAPQLVVHPVHVRGERHPTRRGSAHPPVPEKSPAAISASRASVRWIGPTSDQERIRPSPSASATLTRPDGDEQIARGRVRTAIRCDQRGRLVGRLRCKIAVRVVTGRCRR